MMKLSIVTNSISSVAQSAAIHIKNMCINSKVDAVFRVTVSTAQTHPYITIGLGLATVYCCRGQIEGLINKVNKGTQFFFGRIKNILTNATSIFRRDSTSEQTPSPIVPQQTPSPGVEDNLLAKSSVSRSNSRDEFRPTGT